MSVPFNLTIVTLGVTDVVASAAFYRRLGWAQHGDPAAGITWFRTSGTWVGLFGYRELAADIGLPAEVAESPPPAYRGMTLAINVADEPAVDAALAAAVAAGARLVKPAERAEWGGYSGYFADLDGASLGGRLRPRLPRLA